MKKLTPFLVFLIPLNFFSFNLNERIFYQKKIEEVFYKNRVWPKENKKPKPAFDEVINEEKIKEKVLNFLKKEQTLKTFFKKEIKTQDMEEELKRIMKNTKDPEMLKEIFSALKNNKYLIFECLIKPIMVERFFENYCLKFKENGLLEDIDKFLEEENFSFEKIEAEDFNSFEENFKYMPIDSWDNGILDDPIPLNAGHKAIWTGAEMIIFGGFSLKFEKTLLIYKPSIDLWEKKVSPYHFTGYGSSVVWTGEEMIIWGGSDEIDGSGICFVIIYNPTLDRFSQVPPPGGLECRIEHSAVWTGEEMIIWGGYNDENFLQTGAIYNLKTNSWKEITTKNAPSPRVEHCALWTGSSMIIWGGLDDLYLNSGGIYDPLKDEWKTIRLDTSTPSPRIYNSAVWTGKEMLIWGGEAYRNSLSDGALYDPQKNTWRRIEQLEIYPEERSRHSTIWTGEKMIIWGGCKIRNGDIFEIYNNGYEFDPLKNEWKKITSRGANPSSRYLHSAVWTGDEMIIWGGLDNYGLLNSGGRLNYKHNFWLPVSEGGFAPKARYFHNAIWTGTEMIIFGGIRGIYPEYEYLSDGASYIPALDLWFLLPEPDFQINRVYSTAIWTGLEMIVWGGKNEKGYLNTGARYDPLNNTWKETKTFENFPSKRAGHTAVWTGEEMIIWGGYDGKNMLNSGFRYNPELDLWTEMSMQGYPLSPRVWHSGVWTGKEMIVWGGYIKQWDVSNEGAIYDPVIDFWKRIKISEDTPEPRSDATAIWTGDKMIIFGGGYNTYYGFRCTYNNGGVYDPEADSWEKIEFDGEWRESHTVIWTGEEMIIWGGLYYPWKYWTLRNDGFRYDPVTKEFIEFESLEFCPNYRAGHTAIWTGKSMIIWGGFPDYNEELKNGCIYFPGKKIKFKN